MLFTLRNKFKIKVYFNEAKCTDFQQTLDLDMTRRRRAGGEKETTAKGQGE